MASEISGNFRFLPKISPHSLQDARTQQKTQQETMGTAQRRRLPCFMYLNGCNTDDDDENARGSGTRASAVSATLALLASLMAFFV